MKDANEIAMAIVPILVNRVGKAEYSITYGRLAKMASEHLGYDVNPHFDLAEPLAIVQNRCVEYGAPCLSALAVNQAHGRPGAGFEPYYRSVHNVVPEMTIEEILAHEQNEIQRFNDWEGFLHSLGLSSEVGEVGEAQCDKLDGQLAKLYREYNYGKQSILATEIRRNDSAREACLRHYGAVCQICEFDSFDYYGVPGIIHVHHKDPAANKDGAYDINPITDLVPLCPNCHALVHSKKRDCAGGVDAEVVYTVEEAKAILERRGSKRLSE